MDDGKFWVIIWSLAATVLVVLIVATTVYNVDKTQRIAAHPNPLELACAIDGEHSTLQQNCTVLALRPR